MVEQRGDPHAGSVRASPLSAFTEGATVRRPSRTVIIALGAMTLPVIGFTLVAAGATKNVRAWVGVLAVVESFSLLALAAFFPRVFWGAGPARATRVDVDEAGLKLDGKLTLARADIASVSVAPGADGRAHLVVAGARPLSTLDIDVASETAARALAAALDDTSALDATLPSFLVESEPLSASRRVRTLAERALLGVPIFGALLWLTATHLRAVVPVGYVPLVIGFAFMLGRRGAPTRAVLGADGVLFRARRAAPRFVPFTEVSTLTAVARGAELVLKDGGRLKLLVPGVDPTADAQAITLAECLAKAHSEAGDGATDPRIVSHLAREGRPAADWMRALRALRARGSYRDVALGDERLLGVIESNEAPPSARVGAAMLLREAGILGRSAGVEARVRAVASRAAAPGLRVALESTLADGTDDESLAHAFGALER